MLELILVMAATERRARDARFSIAFLIALVPCTHSCRLIDAVKASKTKSHSLLIIIIIITINTESKMSICALKCCVLCCLHQYLVGRPARVLTIQSHTVRGHVGNKAAVLPMQLLGFEVDPINSVQFCNHTGYGKFAGDRLDGDQLWALVEGLEANTLLGDYTHVLTGACAAPPCVRRAAHTSRLRREPRRCAGYIGSLSFLRTVGRVVDKLRELNPDLVYGVRTRRVACRATHAATRVCCPLPPHRNGHAPSPRTRLQCATQ